MNDFENKLRSRKFLTPPGQIRRKVLALSERMTLPNPGNWMEWLWPSPLVWGGLTAILFAAFLFNALLSAPRVPPATARAIQSEPPHPGLYALFQRQPTPPWSNGNFETLQ